MVVITAVLFITTITTIDVIVTTISDHTLTISTIAVMKSVVEDLPHFYSFLEWCTDIAGDVGHMVQVVLVLLLKREDHKITNDLNFEHVKLKNDY